MNKLLVLTVLLSFVAASLQQAPTSILGANCIPVPTMSNAIFEYAQNSTHLVVQVRISGLGSNSWVSIGMGSTTTSPMGTTSKPQTMYVGFMNSVGNTYNEYLSSDSNTPASAGGNFAIASTISTSNGVTTFTVVRTTARPAGSPALYHTIPSSGAYDISVAYLNRAGGSSFIQHNQAKKFSLSTITVQNTCTTAPAPATGASVSVSISLLALLATAMQFL